MSQAAGDKDSLATRAGPSPHLLDKENRADGRHGHQNGQCLPQQQGAQPWQSHVAICADPSARMARPAVTGT